MDASAPMRGIHFFNPSLLSHSLADQFPHDIIPCQLAGSVGVLAELFQAERHDVLNLLRFFAADWTAWEIVNANLKL